MDQSQVTTITLEPPQIRRNFHNQSNLWSVIWRSRMNQSANQSHVGLGDWWRTYHSSPTGRAPDTRGHRHDLPQTSSQPYYHTPGRLVICDMPYTGADITNATDQRSNITRHHRFTRASFMESRGTSTVDINCWISSSRIYLYTQLSILGRYVRPQPWLTRVPIDTSDVLDQDGATNTTTAHVYMHDATHALDGAGVSPYMHHMSSQTGTWVDDWCLDPHASEPLIHNQIWCPRHVTQFDSPHAWS